MNYLAHAFLSGDNPEVQLGGLLGDFCKGILPPKHNDDSPLFLQQENIRFGIEHHRALDAHSDKLESFAMCGAFLGKKFRRVAPIITDICFDHYLAKHWQHYHQQHLDVFAKDLYLSMDNCPQAPANFQRFCQRSKEANLFSIYQDTNTIAVALERVAQRFSRPQMMAGAYEEWLLHYGEMEEAFEFCFDQIKQWASGRLEENGHPYDDWR